jgi:hypothetical protein
LTGAVRALREEAGALPEAQPVGERFAVLAWFQAKFDLAIRPERGGDVIRLSLANGPDWTSERPSFQPYSQQDVGIPKPLPRRLGLWVAPELEHLPWDALLLPEMTARPIIGFGRRRNCWRWSRPYEVPWAPELLQYQYLWPPWRWPARRVRFEVVAPMTWRPMLEVALGDLASSILAATTKSFRILVLVGTAVETSAGSGVHLALHQGFSPDGGGGGNVLRPGYHAVILAGAAQVPVGELRVEGDRLYRGGAPFTTHDFMLLRIEARNERPDWRGPGILDARNHAIDAFQRGDKDDAQHHLGSAISAVYRSYDFTEADKRRIVTALKEEWKDLEALGLGAAGAAPPATLKDLVAAYPLSRAAAAALGPLTAEEAFAMP